MSTTPTWNGTTPMMTFKSPNPIQIGINGHPTYAWPYGSMTGGGWEKGISLATQIQYIKDLGCDHYRFSHFVATYEADFLWCCQQLAANGIKVFPVVYGNGSFTGDTDAAALQTLYNACYAEGAAFATAYDAYVVKYDGCSVYEIGNEVDVSCITGADVDGALPAHYTLSKMKRAYWYLKGLRDGVRSVVPTAKICINTAGWYHLGVFRMLKNPAWMDSSMASWSPIDWDITGHHYYSNVGLSYAQGAGASGEDTNFLRLLVTEFGKPIWINEIGFNGGAGYVNSNSDTLQEAFYRQWIKDIFMNSEYSSHIIGITTYELYNEPNQYFGLRSTAKDGNNVYSDAGARPAYNSAKSTIQYLKNTHTNP